MEKKKEFEPRIPDYKGDGIAVWVEEKDDKTVLVIKKTEWAKSLMAFKNEPKEEVKKEIKL